LGLQAIADFLDEHEEMIEAIRSDPRCGLKRPDTGRKGLTAQQVLRSLILRSSSQSQGPSLAASPPQCHRTAHFLPDRLAVASRNGVNG